jgi:expansin
MGCGASEEGDGVPAFSGLGNGGAGSVVGGGGTGGTGLSNQSPNGLGGSPTGGAGTPPSGVGGTGSAACTTGDCTQPMNVPCTPNTVACQGNSIATCNAMGTGSNLVACPTSSVCSMASGIPACSALPPPTCEANSTFCESANNIGHCSADGNSVTTERCPTGTNCTGAGQCAAVACNQTALLNHNGNGGVTVYWFAQGTLSNPPQAGQDVNCSFNGTRAANDDGGANDRVAYIQDPGLFGAMNSAEYGGAAACGACVQLSQGGRNVTITVADSCNPANGNPTCTNGHIDLSRNAFQTLTGQSTGDINGISWRYVPCEGVDNIQFQLKEPNNQYWNQFLVVGTRFPIVKAEVKMADGTWVEARREAFNYWTPQRGMPDGDMGTYRVRVTDINGGIVEEQLALTGGLQGGTGQFGCQ